MGNNDVNADHQHIIDDQDRVDIHHILEWIFDQMQNDSIEDDGFVDNGTHDLLNVTEEES